jgi:hypothetical protein
MKTKKLFPGIALLSIVYALACSKEKVVSNNTNSFTAAQSSNAVTSVCDKFSYGDTIFYPQELPNDYIIHTVTPLKGTFGCFPDELKINATNGDIDITEGETGLKYIVWFVPAGTKDTCKKFIQVSGIDYTDSIYSLTKRGSKARSVYNSTPGLAVATNSVFDDSNNVVSQGVALDRATGNIDLKQTIANGALGANPLPGTFKDFLLYYRISDKSNKARNKLAFRMYYFQNKTQIPARLKKQLAQKKSQVILNDRGTNLSSINLPASPGTTSKNGAGEVKCRPPYIIVVQQ